MALIDVKLNPSRKELLVFALLWALFFLLMAKLARATPHALLVAALVTGAAFLISIAFNGDYPRRKQIIGVAIPFLLLLIGGLEKYASVDAKVITYTLWAIGGAGLVAIALVPALGKAIYTQWMFAAMPIGWTMSQVILGAVFYLLFTPIGLLLRLFGHDTMHKRTDPAAATYWHKRETNRPSASYFRQF
ncbi:MAG: hypothetical protein K8S99_11290 [Planctomycetes bacterium]|nr:hypothetical protein [Planctomycetota bacterium]